MGSIATEIGIDGLESANEIENIFAIHGTASGLAEVGTTTKGARLIDEALLGLGLKKRAGTVGGCGQRFAACGTEALGCEKSFATGEVGGTAGEFKLATFGTAKAVALDGALGEVGVDGANGGEGSFQASRI